MSQPAVAVPHGPWTLDDLLSLPEDGARYELVDGSLHVSPPLSFGHGLLAASVFRLLDTAAPLELLVLPGGPGIHVRLPGRETQFLVPDVLVVRADVADRDVYALDPTDVVLAVEVVSPSSITSDRVTKRELYALLGIPHYWIVDPQAGGLVVRLLRLRDSSYVEEAVVSRGEEHEVRDPFPLLLRPLDLRS